VEAHQGGLQRGVDQDGALGGRQGSARGADAEGLKEGRVEGGFREGG
jgi:hypothetical protein